MSRQKREILRLLKCSLFVAPVFFCLLNTTAPAQKAGAAKPRTGQSQAGDLTPQSQALLEAGIRLLEEQRFAEAEIEIRKCIKLSPRSSVAFNILGVVLDEQNKTEDALAAFQTSIKLAPAFVSPKNNLGRLLAKQGKFPEALKQFEAILAVDAKHEQARFNAASIYEETENFTKAAQYFDVLRRNNPQDARLAISFLTAALKAGMKTEANELINALESAGGANPQILFTLGVILAQNLEYERALGLFKKVNDLQPGTFEVLYNLGLSYDNLKRPDDAILYLAQAADLQPEKPEVHVRLGLIATEKGDHTNAAEEFRHAVALDEKNHYYRYLLARSYFLAGFWEGSVKEFTLALAQDPTNLVYLESRAKAYFRKMEWLAAANDYEQIKKLNPGFKDVDYLIGLTYRSAGVFDKANPALKACLAINPNNVECLANLGFVQIEQGNLPEASATLQKTLQLDPRNITALYDSARISLKERNYSEAAAKLEKVVAINRFNPQTHYQLFIAYSRMKQTDKAKVALDEFKRLDELEKQALKDRVLDERRRSERLLGTP